MFWNLNLGFCNLLCAFFIFLPYRCGLGASTLLMLFGKESENWREFWLQQMLECDLARATLSQNHRHAYHIHITTIGSPLFRGLVRGTQRAGAAFQKFLGFKMSTWEMKKVEKNENVWTDHDIPAMLESFLLPPEVWTVALHAPRHVSSGCDCGSQQASCRCTSAFWCAKTQMWKELSEKDLQKSSDLMWFVESVQSEDSGYIWACGY